MNIPRITLAIIAVLTASSAVLAQDFKMGAQLTLSIPNNSPYGDLGNKPGYGFGLHGMIPLKGSHAITPRVDFYTYNNKKDYTITDPFLGKYTETHEEKITALSIGADYQYYFGGNAGSQGFYVLGGVLYSSIKDDLSFSVSSATVKAKATLSTSDRILGAAGGGGYLFKTNMGAELRYNLAGLGSNAPTINASLFFRF
jgi:hypothetical protein